MAKYYIGLQFPAKNPDNGWMHVTLSFCGMCDDNKLDRMKKAVDQLAPLLPIKCNFTHKELFGVTLVMIVELDVPEDIKAKLADFHREFYDQDSPFKSEPKYHLSLGNDESELEGVTGFTGSEIYIKLMGPNGCKVHKVSC
jgi:2'-5' RNA ligase